MAESSLNKILFQWDLEWPVLSYLKISDFFFFPLLLILSGDAKILKKTIPEKSLYFIVFFLCASIEKWINLL